MTSPRANFRLTARDLELLRFISVHRFVLAAHVHAWLNNNRSVAYRRLAGLKQTGLLAYCQPLHPQPGCFYVTKPGLRLLDSWLSTPALDLASFRHDAALVWLWLHQGSQAQRATVLTERQMRAHDRNEEPQFALELHSTRGPRHHYPDLLTHTPDGRNQALELELTQKSRSRLEAILLAYAASPVVSVLYLTDRAVIARAVEETAAALGLGHRVHTSLTLDPVAIDRPCVRSSSDPSSPILTP